MKLKRCVWDLFNGITDVMTLQSNCLTIHKASKLNQIRQVDQLDYAETLAATPNNWQIWKCLKWIPAQNRCYTPQLKEKKPKILNDKQVTTPKKGMKFLKNRK